MGENEGVGIFCAHSQQPYKGSALTREGNRNKCKGSLVKGREKL